MARGGINLAVVKIARDALLARGKHPSIDAVRIELGNTGSKSTILRYLKELEAWERTPPPPTVDEELQSLIGAVGSRLTTLAEEQVADSREQLNRDRATYEQQRLQLSTQLAHLQQAYAAQNHELQALREHERTLQERLRDADGERRRLAQSEQSLQQLLAERAVQIQSLEDKHRQAREALEHFRQQHMAQREQETQRHDSQLRQAQHELRGVRSELLEKQEALVRSFQDNERLVGERRASQQRERHLEREVEQLTRQHQSAEDRQRLEQLQTQALSTELAGLRERVRQHLLKERQHLRNLRAQTRQLVHLQGLLTQTPGAPAPAPK